MNATISAPIAGRDQHLVVVVAHPDDESFGCGSLIAQASRAGARVTVICATRGEAGERRPDPTTDAWPIGLLREAELCQAAIVLGVDEVVLMDLVDSGFSGEAPRSALISRPICDRTSSSHSTAATATATTSISAMRSGSPSHDCTGRLDSCTRVWRAA